MLKQYLIHKYNDGTMKKLFQWTDGKKTYALALLGVVWALVGWKMAYISPVEAQEILWASLTVAALRRGVTAK